MSAPNAVSRDREQMAQVIVGLKVLPKTVEVDLDKLEEKIKAAIDPEKIQREPIAFGLVAFLIVKYVQDAEGEMEKIESKLKAIEEVGEVEVTAISRGYSE
jgi:translation elongation factor aEF-1 beta